MKTFYPMLYWNKLLNSITMATVIGASPIPKFVSCWGTPSSTMRKFPRGILGIKRPFLSKTETSTVTVFTSLRKVGVPSAITPPCFLYLDGIFSASASAAVSPLPVFFFGRETVVDDSVFGPCCPESNPNPNAVSDKAISRRVSGFMLKTIPV